MARAKKAPTGPLSEAALTVLLKERFAAPEYAFLPHVRNGTGYVRRTTRTADALAMGLWPSRGLDLHGFEIKSDRRDWLNEKANPEKAEEIARFCDRWWLVTGAPGIVHVGELPPAWGLLVAEGGKLVLKMEAQKLEAQPLDRAQLAAILRRAAECVVPKAEIKAEVERAYQRGREDGKKLTDESHVHERHDHERIQASVKAFEAASGVEIDHWRGGPIGEAVRVVMRGGAAREERRLRELYETAQEVTAALQGALADLPAAKIGTEG